MPLLAIGIIVMAMTKKILYVLARLLLLSTAAIYLIPFLRSMVIYARRCYIGSMAAD